MSLAGRARWTGCRSEDAGYRFAFIRATIGDRYVDPRFDANWRAARDAGLLVSAYHAMTPDTPADDQVGHLFDVLDGRAADLPLAVDAERDDGQEPAEITRCLMDCLDAVASQDGRAPIVYTARWYWNRHVLTSVAWAAYDLWVASYTAKPAMPSDWTAWRFWQYSERGRVPGIAASTDLNWFDGDLG